MRRRIVILAVISAIVATSLFGLPLAAAVALQFLSQESTEVEHTADIAALDVTSDVAHSRQPGVKLAQPPGTDVALYGPDGRLVDGRGPNNADETVRAALTDNMIHHHSGLQTMVAAVPIADLAGGTYAVRTSSATSEVYPKIGLTWLGMLALGGVIVVLTWRLGQRQARRLARPVEDLADSASRLADGDFTVVAPRSGIVEIDTAARALNHAATRIGDLVQRERSITDHASHQLRTPLAGLRLSLENALATPHADYQSAMQEAIASADRLERTIDEMVGLARSRDRSASEPPDIPALFNEIAALWSEQLARRGRSLRQVVDPNLVPPRCSVAAVRQIIAVLVDNAVRHGVGTVTTRARETIGTVAIDVCDEGAVLDARDDVFNQVRVRGHGIGLHLARSLAEGAGGRLLLTSSTPTTFTFFLPGDESTVQLGQTELRAH